MHGTPSAKGVNVNAIKKVVFGVDLHRDTTHLMGQMVGFSSSRARLFGQYNPHQEAIFIPQVSQC